MDDQTKHIIEGRKTFFITPDVSLLPETYLEDFMTRGYETYIINDDRFCPITKKVEIIINTFPDSILFFYIDTQIEGIDWPVYIKRLHEHCEGKVLIGVLYAKRTNEAQKKKLEKYYLFDIGIQCGCISLEYQKSKNFALIDAILYANQACGRRKTVRALCDANSKALFETASGVEKGKILDISMSHFSCVFDNPPDIKMYEKIKRTMLNINGLHFMSDTILLMTRTTETSGLYIFVFANSVGQQGLDPDSKDRLTRKIYLMISEKAKKLMQSKFDEARKELQKATPFARNFVASDFFN